MCKRCKPLYVPQTSFVSAVAGPIRFIDVRCTNCTAVMTTSGGIAIPLSTGDWYSVSEVDIVSWIQQGFIFEFRDVNDAIYLQDKYTL